jgi:hypothetical protein
VTVALYEIVLRFADREVRLGEGDPYEPDEEVVIEDRRFVVVGVESPRTETASKRFILEPVGASGE